MSSVHKPSAVRLFNTLSRQVEEFLPRCSPLVSFYACGPTVYDFTHLGHLRKYVMDDILVRHLRHAGFKVKHVMNLTDVGHLVSDGDTGEDKLEKGAKKYGQSVWELAARFTEYFFYSMGQMGVIRPDITPRVTDHISQQIKLVQQLESKGFTYIISEDGVYFDTAKFPSYGELARRTDADLEEGARIGVVAGKRNPSDFALWKFERKGEHRQMAWESPWAKRGFPGWHIECSTLAHEYLGEQIDVHTGGVDHISVHHANEIAQSEAASGKSPFVRYWVHHNFLQIENQKMSKSLGNFATVDDVIARGFHPLALRLYFLGTHYRSKMNFTWANLAGVQRSWEKLLGVVQATLTDGQLGGQPDIQSIDLLGGNSGGWSWEQQFWAALSDDLNTPQAVAIMWQMLKSNLDEREKTRLLLSFDQVLGLGLAKAPQLLGQEGGDEKQQLEHSQLPEPVQVLLWQRQAARESKDWQTADKVRQQLLEMGYGVRDEQDKQAVFVQNAELGQIINLSPNSELLQKPAMSRTSRSEQNEGRDEE